MGVFRFANPEWDGNSCGDSENEVELDVDGDYQMQLATALSLSATADGSGEHPGNMSSASSHDFPDFLSVDAIEPNGWCFYDCVLKHLCPAQEDGQEGQTLTKAMVGVLCLTCLAQRKEEMCSIVVDDEDVAVRRFLALEREPMYRPYLASLDTFGKYVLDKLEMVLHPPNVLGTQ